MTPCEFGVFYEFPPYLRGRTRDGYLPIGVKQLRILIKVIPLPVIKSRREHLAEEGPPQHGPSADLAEGSGRYPQITKLQSINPSATTGTAMR